jgi:hypothetical protein
MWSQTFLPPRCYGCRRNREKNRFGHAAPAWQGLGLGAGNTVGTQSRTPLHPSDSLRMAIVFPWWWQIAAGKRMPELKMRRDRTLAVVRKLVEEETDARVARRLLTIANTLSGMSRKEAASSDRMDRHRPLKSLSGAKLPCPCGFAAALTLTLPAGGERGCCGSA